jgi:predicted nuclease of predicted toxin-antitoxin system
MLRLVSDEDVHGDIIRGLLRQAPDLDLIRTQDVGLRGSPDTTVLAWAAAENRVLITQDRKTLVGSAWVRVTAGEAMPGVLALRPHATIGEAIDDIILVARCYDEEDMRDQVIYIPLS